MKNQYDDCRGKPVDTDMHRRRLTWSAGPIYHKMLWEQVFFTHIV